MKRSIVQQPASREDLVDIYDYLEARNPRAADRFLAVVDRTFSQLATHPGLGEPYDSPEPELRGLRVCRVIRFRSYLVFYRATDEELVVIRVFHGARGDIDDLLGESFGPG